MYTKQIGNTTYTLGISLLQDFLREQNEADIDGWVKRINAGEVYQRDGIIVKYKQDPQKVRREY